uniref:XPA C-terminal domain-containing protein n=1 Tax=Helicotheca tamesis TaxID=374047 RepID=A0A7S2MFG3_9STRA|mmetsp:Transcript_15174/g.20703  ORF Transcript_15174/g.20703 Transcript_15174/m.20703 type:complete len:195 (+) Transcript_15174:270-854(+)
MVLTEEQKEKIRKNRERALEIRRKRLADAAQNQDKLVSSSPLCNDGGQKRGAGKSVGVEPVCKRSRNIDAKSEEDKQRSDSCHIKNNKEENNEECTDDLEDFERDVGPHVTKSEAMQMYCLPEGTLAVCSYVEKENPRRKGWNKMKLYNRAEIRRRARKRYGGLDGLIEERAKRSMKRFEKDLEETKDIFKRKR